MNESEAVLKCDSAGGGGGGSGNGGWGWEAFKTLQRQHAKGTIFSVLPTEQQTCACLGTKVPV